MNNYVTYRTLSAFGYKGDFLDRRVVAIYKNTILILFYAENDSFRAPSSQYNRGRTIIGIHIIKIENSIQTLTFIQQTDLNSSLARLAAKLGPRKMKDWCKEYRNQVYKKYPNNI